MPNQPLNPDALEAAKRTFALTNPSRLCAYEDLPEKRQQQIDSQISQTIETYLAVAQPEVSTVEAFINQRPEYITALKNTRGTDDQSDYHRWQGHAEARRHLAEDLGWILPHNPGETTGPAVNDA